MFDSKVTILIPPASSIDLNMLYLSSIQDYLNDKLKARGYLYVHEVYEALGVYTDEENLEPEIGWRYKECEDEYDYRDTDAEWDSDAIYLNFNVDGTMKTQE